MTDFKTSILKPNFVSNYVAGGGNASHLRLVGLFIIEILLIGIVFLSLFLLAAPVYALPGNPDVELTHDSTPLFVPDDPPFPADDASIALSPPAIPHLQQATYLTVSIVSSPWAALDHNNPGGTGGEQVPKVFVVEAVITNTSFSTTATDLNVELDYYKPGSDWILLNNEDSIRTIDELAPGEAYHVYWFARYPTSGSGASHQYTVTTWANDISPVATSKNHYNPTGDTVETVAYISNATSDILRTDAEVTVGVAFTIAVRFDLGNNPDTLSFSPVGNTDFEPGAYRLLSSEVHFYNGDDPPTTEFTYTDRLYFDSIPPAADDTAKAIYTFIAVTPDNTSVCPYAAVQASVNKYDNTYCEGDAIIPITGTVSLSLTKRVSSQTIQQSQLLTYTLYYTNNGDLPLTYVWIWDDVLTGVVSIITDTINPASNPDETTDSRVAWYLDDVQPAETGVLTFTIKVDGDGNDLADGASLVNHAFFGINQGSVPQNPALTSTTVTTIEAPTITVSKSDGQAAAEPDDPLTYILRITNTGSVTATGLVITDVLPADVNYTSNSASPPETVRTDQTLTWNIPSPISPNGGTVIVTIPVTVAIKAPNASLLTNTMAAAYQNPAGWSFAPQIATDATTVRAPVLSISKSDYPDPVLTGNVLTYTLHYPNSGPAAASNVLITDVVPLSTTYLGCWSELALPCSSDGNVVSWTVGTVASSTNATVGFSVVVSDTLDEGTLLRNEDYGLIADQSDFISGPAVTTVASKKAAFIHGYAFDDANGNGQKDSGEVGLSGIDITLIGATNPFTPTDGNGYYHFRIETSGPISVTAGLPAGSYFRTTPATVFTRTTLGFTGTVDFGYAPITSSFGAVYGTVFEDANHNGARDLGEGGLPGVEITSAEAMTSPINTNQTGGYTLRYNNPGPETITETNPISYVSTTLDVVQTTVATGSSNALPVDFGDFLGIKITGQVFSDTNVNGVNDDGSGIAGVLIEANGDSAFSVSSGVYTLYAAIHDSNPVWVNETDPSGYVSTNAVPGAGMSKVDANTLQIDSPAAGVVYTGGDFGDVLATAVVTISGTVWDDNGQGGGNLANGQPDGAEPGLAGAIVSLSSGLTQTTASDGEFLLYAPHSEAIAITETNPANYVSTNAIPGDGNVTRVDNDALLVGALSAGSTSADNLFGDVEASSVAVITGTVFNDANENGVLDPGESGFPGATMALEINGGSVISIPTDSAGHYQFAVAPGTEIRITSAGPGGIFYPTTPESVIVTPPAVGLYPNNNFGYSNDADVAVIFGLVFEDLNSDGEQGFGELGLPGAVITLTNGLSTSTTTGGSGLIIGAFRFTVANAGIYGVHETNPPDYRSTTPDDLNVEAVLGQSYYVIFGDTNNTVASIYGVVFDDSNGNGAQDPNESGLPGVVISVTVSGGVITGATSTYGQFTYGFEVEEAGFHTVSEQDPAKTGYRSTTPDEVVLDIALGYSYIVNFGDTDNSTFSSIMGTVFNDISGDGAQDPAEPGISGVSITLSNGLTATTNTYGNYTIPVAETGVVQVVETDPPGYHSTTPNTVAVNVMAPGQVYQIDFGDSDNLFVSSFFGAVFDDQNINGARELTELALSGVTVAITGTFDIPPAPYTTNRWGQFTFLIELTGAYTVTETDPLNYVSTNAIPGSAAVARVDNNTLRGDISSLGSDLGENLFGDVLISSVAVITGAVFDDVNENSIKDPGESGFAGITMTMEISGGSVIIASTDAVGHYQFITAPGSEVRITSAGPGGDFYPTTPEQVIVSPPVVGLHPDNNFGYSDDTTDTAVIFGLVFEDLDANGQQDFGEAGLNGVDIALTNGVSATTTTHSSSALITGAYVFTTSQAGVHTVVETDLAGYFSTTPNEVHVDVSLGNSYQVNFGDALTSSTFAPIYGTVFEDADGDGGLGADEVGISGVTVTLDGAITATTNIYGNYTFSTTVEGVHTVVETDLANYFSTTPNEVHLNVLLGNDYQVNFGDALTDSNFAAIYGVVFEDANGNGLWDVDETGIPTVTITLDDGSSTTTDIHGSYTFSTTETGLHTVVETDPDNYFSTTPNEVHVDVVSLGNDYQVDFGDALTDSNFAAIYGVVFEDANGNGLWDVDETGIPTVTITLDDGSSSTTTDIHGSYTFSTTETGLHTVVETDPDNYFSTTPNEVHVDVVSLGTDYQVNFGDALTDSNFAAIYGTVFNDANGDGVWDDDETGILSVTITLDDAITTTTDMYGSYTFANVSTGTHTVVETDPAGYFSTTPNEVHVDVSLGNSYQVNFGDALTDSDFAAIYGTVFNDANSDGVWDNDETGLADVVITLQDNITTTTNIYGSYTFSTTNTGLHTVVETDPPGYTSTTSNTVEVDVALNNGYPINFGDIAGCQGDEYEPDDSLGQAQPLAALVGNQIITQAHTFHFPADEDWLELTVQPGAEYTFSVSDFGSQIDPLLTLYAAGGVTIDQHSSLIQWTAPISELQQTVYLAVTQSQPPDLSACGTGYTLSLAQSVGGDLDNLETDKLVEPAASELTVGDRITYTIVLSNSDSRWAAPVTVSDTLPISVTLDSVVICQPVAPPVEYVIYLPVVFKQPSSSRAQSRSVGGNAVAEGDDYIQYSLTVTDNSFTWVGAVGPTSQLRLCVSGVVEQMPWDLANTAWIGWNDQVITRSVVSPLPLKPEGNIIYLPVVMKN